jgi:Tfp pilus assembly protein PilZ
MRLITVAFPSAAAFLAAYDENSIVARTRTDGGPGEVVLVEISFPGLPNRPLVRATVSDRRRDEDGLCLTFSDDDSSTRDFLLGLARGELRVESTVQRDHKRFPAALPVEYRVADNAEVRYSLLDDLGAGGCFVRAVSTPALGARVGVRIRAPDGGELRVDGVVAWIRPQPPSGFGVDFERSPGDALRRVRMLLRQAQETGEIDLSGVAPTEPAAPK